MIKPNGKGKLYTVSQRYAMTRHEKGALHRSSPTEMSLRVRPKARRHYI
jgi:hypothetical protein